VRRHEIIKDGANLAINNYVTTNRQYLQEIVKLPLAEQKEFLIEHGDNKPIKSYKQTDFVKERVAVEVQFGKYAFVAFDLFVKHLLFYTGDVINVGVSIACQSYGRRSEWRSVVVYRHSLL
jgi:hypothetical protein